MNFIVGQDLLCNQTANHYNCKVASMLDGRATAHECDRLCRILNSISSSVDVGIPLARKLWHMEAYFRPAYSWVFWKFPHPRVECIDDRRISQAVFLANLDRRKVSE